MAIAKPRRASSQKKRGDKQQQQLPDDPQQCCRPSIDSSKQRTPSPTVMGSDNGTPPPAVVDDENTRAKRAFERGLYLPPAKRRQFEEIQQEKVEEEPYGSVAQLSSWEEERKVINGTINRLNDRTIKPLLHDLFDKVNLVRMRGVLAKALLQATLVSAQRYGAVYAAALSVLHSKLPEVGDLVVQRAILHFRRSYQRKDKPGALAMTLLLGHLFHQSVIHELLILQILSLLLQGDPTDDSVQIAIRLLRLTGYALQEVSPAGVRAVLEQLRGLIHQGGLHPKIQQEAEDLLDERRRGFTSQISPELDLVEADDQITLDTSLDDEDLAAEEELNQFQPDENFEQTVNEWKSIRAEVLGLNDDDDESDDDDAETDGGSDEDGEDDEEVSEHEGALVAAPDDAQKALVVVEDMTEADLVHLRRTIYLTIMSSATFEECTHKLAKIDIPEGREEELVNMLLECCAQERTFLRYYGLIGARFCFIADRWKEAFMAAFAQQYSTIHRLETNKLRNVAKLLAHVLHTDGMPWSVLSTIHLNEEETTSSSRIFLKILFQEMAEALGMQKLKERLEAPQHAEWYAQLLPRDNNLRNTRYAINFFTSVGLGPLTDSMRAYLKEAPKLLAAEQERKATEQKEHESDEDSSSMSSSSSSSSSSVSSQSSSSASSGSSSSSSSTASSYSRRRGRRSRRSRSYSSDSDSSGKGDSRQVRHRRRRQGSDSSDVDRRGGGRSEPSSRESRRGKETDSERDEPRKIRSPEDDNSGGRSSSRRKDNREIDTRGDRDRRRKSPTKDISSLDDKGDRRQKERRRSDDRNDGKRSGSVDSFGREAR
jgi:pre-mRNA-splicing factor CWC22